MCMIKNIRASLGAITDVDMYMKRSYGRSNQNSSCLKRKHENFKPLFGK